MHVDFIHECRCRACLPDFLIDYKHRVLHWGMVYMQTECTLQWIYIYIYIYIYIFRHCDLLSLTMTTLFGRVHFLFPQNKTSLLPFCTHTVISKLEHCTKSQWRYIVFCIVLYGTHSYFLSSWTCSNRLQGGQRPPGWFTFTAAGSLNLTQLDTSSDSDTDVKSVDTLSSTLLARGRALPRHKHYTQSTSLQRHSKSPRPRSSSPSKQWCPSPSRVVRPVLRLASRRLKWGAHGGGCHALPVDPSLSRNVAPISEQVRKRRRAWIALRNTTGWHGECTPESPPPGVSGHMPSTG